MKQNVRLEKAQRVLAMFLAIVMVMSVLPLSVFATSAGTVSTNISEKDFIVGTPTEFTITTTANDDLGKMIIGTAEFSDPSAIEKLEYYEIQDGNWYVLEGDFGPSSGFPMSDAESKFRVTFKKAGIYSVEVFIKSVEDNSIVCSTTATAIVKGKSTFTTDASDKSFVVNEPTEFTFTTTPANEDAGKMVIGTAEFSDRDAIQTLEYYEVQDDNWYPLVGDFGPSTGFPLSDATSKFRVTFNKAGKYTLNAYMKEVESGDILCLTSANIVVKNRSAISFAEETLDIKYSDVNAFNSTLNDAVADAEYVYVSGDEKIVKVNNDGILTPVGLGETTITVTRIENEDYVAASASYAVKVVAGIQNGLSWIKTIPQSIRWNDPTGYSNTVIGGSGDGKVTYTSDNPEVASVDAVTGVLELKKPGIVTITATKSGETLFEDEFASYTLSVIKAEPVPLDVAEDNPSFIYVGDKYTNEITGGYADGKIKYESSDESIVTVDENGKVTALKVPNGEEYATVTITASLEGNEFYEDADPVSYNISVYRTPQQNELVFEKGVEGQVIKYGEDYVNAVSGGDTFPVTYVSSNDKVASVDATGKVTAHKAGNVTITASVPESEIYQSQSLSYDLVIELADQTVEFTKGNTNIDAITYGDEYQNEANAITDISYSSDRPDIAEVNKDGELIIHKSGNVTITATAQKTEKYDTAYSSYTITINKAAQIISFDDTKEPEITFNDNQNEYCNKATSNATDADEEIDILYKLITGSDIVTGFNEKTGEFTVTGAGTIIVNVSFGANDRYDLNSDSYTLNVLRDDQNISFYQGEKELASGDTITMTNGDNSFVAPIASEKGELHSSYNIVYSIKEDPDKVLSDINTETGELRFTNRTGEVVILATKPSDNNYNAAESTYILKIKDAELNGSVFYTLEGSKIDSESDWFTGNVSIKAAEGYLISRSKELNSADWKDQLYDEVVSDGKHEISFFMKNKVTGQIYEEDTVTIIRDTTVPTADIKHEGLNGWEKFLSIITLGLWEPSEMNFTIEYNDETSGVAKVEYLVVEDSTNVLDDKDLAVIDSSEWKDYTGSISVPGNKSFVVYSKVTDNAGQCVYVTTNGIVFDKAPVNKDDIAIIPITEEAGGIYNKDVELKVQVSDALPSSGINSITYEVLNKNVPTQSGTLFQFDIDNPTYEQLVPEWDSSEYGKNIIVDSFYNNSDDVIVKVTVTDNAGHVTVNELPIKISIEIPTVSVSYVNGPVPVETFNGVDYYDSKIIAKVVLTGRKSVIEASASPVFNITETGGDTDEVKTYEISKPAIGTVDGDPDSITLTYHIAFNGSANYQFSVEFNDIFGNEIKTETDLFTVDVDNPIASVSINEDKWTKLLTTLTFGLWKNNGVVVSASAVDATSPIKTVEYYKSNSDTILSTTELDKVEWELFEEQKIDKDEQFVIYLKVTDVAGNYDYFCSDGIIIDTKESNIVITPDEPNENGIYNDDFNLRIDVNDIAPYSGIKTVEYWVTCDGVETVHKTVYSYEYVRDEGLDSNGGHLIVKELDENGDLVTVLDKTANIPEKSDLKETFATTVTVDAEANNGDNVSVFVKAVDNAGNTVTQKIEDLKIDVVDPKINVSFDTNEVNLTDNRGYLKTNRVATVVFTERITGFDKEKATAGIVISGVDKNGKEITLDRYSMIKWDDPVISMDNPDATSHTAHIYFTADANYDFTVSYTDQAGNTCSYDDVTFSSETKAPRYFTVDKTNPTATVRSEGNNWYKLIEVLTFGIFRNDTVSVSADAIDNTSPVTIKYYKTDNVNRLDKDILDDIPEFEWNDYSEIEVTSDDRFVVYFKVTDRAGNYIYISNDGTIVDMTEADISLEPDPTDHYHDLIPLYNKDVNVKVDVVDRKDESYSGINKVEYWVECDGKETQREILYVFENSSPAYADLVSSFSKTVTINSELNNSCDVILYVGVTDNAGNYSEESIEVDIDITAPEILLSYNNNNPNKTVEEKGYFAASRTATVTITERAEHFDALKATDSIIISAVNSSDVSVIEDCSSLISKWTTEGFGNGATHTATVDFSMDANYEFTLSYKDLASNECEYTDVKYTTETVTPRCFAVDKTAPTGTVTVSQIGTWDKLIEILTFGLWTADSVDVTYTSDDEITPIESVTYYKTSDTTAKSIKELSDVTTWETFDYLTIVPDEKVVVYVRIIDYSGNVTYISTDGFVVDESDSEIVITPEITGRFHNGIPLYNGDVDVTISVTEMKDEAYSGIKEVEYWVVCDGVTTQPKTKLYSNEYPMDDYIPEGDNVPVYEELLHKFSDTVTIDSKKNNSCNVSLFVSVTDNAGNEITESIAVDIDVTPPTIDLKYNNNLPIKTVDERGYYSADRTAEITITERTAHFESTKAMSGIKIKAVDINGDPIVINGEMPETDAQGYIVDITKLFGKLVWNTKNSYDPDLSTHTIMLPYDRDANYTFDISYSDSSGNSSNSIDFTKQATPFEFTVDKTDPDVSVTANDYTWDKLLEVLTFGLFSNEQVKISVSKHDETSPIDSIEYYKTDETIVKTYSDLDQVTEWTDITDDPQIVINEDERFVVYLKVTDYAGNYTYVDSDGFILDKTGSDITLIPETTELSHNGKPLYNGDVDVLINISEKKDESYSGLKEVKYWVTCDGNISQSEKVLYSFDYSMNGYASEDGYNVPGYDDLKYEFSESVTIEAEKNNSCNVILYVSVTDNAGNVAEQSVSVDIDITAPEINVSYDNNRDYKTVKSSGYFPEARTATIVITERASHFEALRATEGIRITAVDAAGNNVIEDCSSLISKWVSVGAGDTATHTATVDYSDDANYTFEISYTDLAGNGNNTVDTGDAVTPYMFAVDKTKPTGTITAGKLGTWDKLVEVLTFGLWSKDSVDIVGTSADTTTPVESVSYYKTSDTAVKTEDELNAVTTWKSFNGKNGITVPADEQFVIYLRIIDSAGNVSYISTNGIIVDDTVPAVESVKPEITITPEPSHGIYNSDVTISVSVVDPKSGDTSAYAGLREIRYDIYNMGIKTQDGVLYSFNTTDPTHGQLIQSWSKKDAIVVDKELNNSNDVKIVVYAVDNAGNANNAECNIKIDITAPSIDIIYDNNDGDVSFAESVYFKADRIAQIVVTERNFDPEMVKTVITNTDGYVPEISGWTTVEGDGNGDETVNTTYVVFDKDGDYTFDITCTDTAMNDNSAVDYRGSLAPVAFTIDKTVPVVNITYDNNTALNGNYFNEQRIATITVIEHNFETERVNISLKATNDGVESDLPTVSNWVSNGDIHTASIAYVEDSLYRFDFDYTDKAGNSTADIAVQSFYIDKTAPVLTIEKIVDESANNNEGDIGFVMTATDVNFDLFTPVLTAVVKNGDKFETKKLDIGDVSETKNGKVFTVTNIDSDGIYRVNCTVVDKAGNEYSEVILEKNDGVKYVEKRAGNDILATFSVNRHGSTFEIDENTEKIVEQYYIQNLESDVVVVEINADPLKEYAVTLNGIKLIEGRDYTVTDDDNNGAWMKYTYKVNKDLFAEEGEYKLVVSSKDKADNDAFSDVKDATVEFVVDRTAPVVTVSGIAADGRYQTDKQNVTLIPTDDGGALKSLIVNMVDENGIVIKEVINLTGEALTTELEANGGMIGFEITEGLYQNIQIVCTDCSVDDSETTNTYDTTITNVSVSSSVFMIFWANKPLRWGTISGLGIIIIALIAIIVRRKKKRKDA